MKSGILAAEAAVGAVGPGETAWSPGALDGYDEAVRASYIWSDLHRVRNARPAFRKGFYRGELVAGVSITTLGAIPPGTSRRAKRAKTRIGPPTSIRPARRPRVSSASR